jgi:hypothetical protein
MPVSYRRPRAEPHIGFGSNARRLPNFTHRAAFHSRRLLQRGCVDRQPRQNDLMIKRHCLFSDPPWDGARLCNAVATMTATASPTQSCRRKVRVLRFRFIAADVRRSGMNMGLDMTILQKHAGPLRGKPQNEGVPHFRAGRRGSDCRNGQQTSLERGNGRE